MGNVRICEMGELRVKEDSNVMKHIAIYVIYKPQCNII